MRDKIRLIPSNHVKKVIHAKLQPVHHKCRNMNDVEYKELQDEFRNL